MAVLPNCLVPAAMRPQGHRRCNAAGRKVNRAAGRPLKPTASMVSLLAVCHSRTLQLERRCDLIAFENPTKLTERFISLSDHTQPGRSGLSQRILC